MMTDVRMKWEPENMASMQEIEDRMRSFAAGRGGVTILRNGTLLFINKSEDDEASARKALEEARFLTDFRVKALPQGDFLVALHRAVAVYVGRQEFEGRRNEIEAKASDLKFPSEVLMTPEEWSEEEFLVGLYGRGKMQRDIYNFAIHGRI